MKILISGAGIGGLTAALCCLQRGFDVTVLEQSPVLDDVGAGIQVSPNAMKVFEALNIGELIADRAFTPERIEARMGRSGRQVFTIPLADTAVERWGAPYLHLHRADYIAALEQALRRAGSGSLQLGSEVTGYRQHSDKVSALLADGAEMEADVLIGADGIHSAVRTVMLGEQAAQFTGNVAWRAVVPMEKLGSDAPPRSACLWFGPGRHCVTYQLRGGELANLVAVVERSDWTEESWSQRGNREEALADFAGWDPVVQRILENADELYRWALFDRPPLANWCDDRVTLLGDAAHPMLPFLAQGAAMAVEDAWVLADCLDKGGVDISAALLRYQHKRHARTALVQKRSRANTKVFHRRSWASQTATYGPMWLAGVLMPSIVHRQNDFLYAPDVTRE